MKNDNYHMSLDVSQTSHDNGVLQKLSHHVAAQPLINSAMLFSDGTCSETEYSIKHCFKAF